MNRTQGSIQTMDTPRVNACACGFLDPLDDRQPVTVAHP